MKKQFGRDSERSGTERKFKQSPRQKTQGKGPVQQKDSRRPVQKKDTSLPSSVEGTLIITTRGSGVVRSREIEKSIEIATDKLNTALHGDTVTVKVLGPSRYPDSLIGEIEKINRRSKRMHAGTLEKKKDVWVFSGSDPRLYTQVKIVGWKNGTGENDVKEKETVVLVQITKWNGDKVPDGDIIKIAGPAGAPDTEEQVFAMERGFDGNFPANVEKEAEDIRSNFSAKESLPGRRDMRGVFTCTIDPADAKDFDDALSFQKLKNGNIEIGIHIADVAYFIKPGSALDVEARERATSVYLVDRTIPMLPEALSTDLCSLTPGTDKCAMSVIVEMTPHFKIVGTWFGRTMIHSQKRFTYEEAYSVLTEGGEFKGILGTLNTIAKELREKRLSAGALSLESDEIKFKLDDAGFPIGIMRKVRNDAHKLVEEFMLLANALVAEKLSSTKHEGAMLYRIHDKPTLEKMNDLAVFFKSLGHHVELKGGVIPTHALSAAIAKTENETIKNVLQSIIIRSQQKAIYSAENKGHFGLALTYYTHFTSPIRRYPDVVIHRLLADMTSGKTSVPKSLSEIASHSSLREVDAQEAERASDKYYQTLYMSDKVGRVFSGTVTGMNERGLFIRDNESFSEGYVRFKDQFAERFLFERKKYTVTGEKTGMKYSLGDSVQIKVTAVRPDRREIDYTLVVEESK